MGAREFLAARRLILSFPFLFSIALFMTLLAHGLSHDFAPIYVHESLPWIAYDIDSV